MWAIHARALQRGVRPIVPAGCGVMRSVWRRRSRHPLSSRRNRLVTRSVRRRVRSLRRLTRNRSISTMEANVSATCVATRSNPTSRRRVTRRHCGPGSHGRLVPDGERTERVSDRHVVSRGIQSAERLHVALDNCCERVVILFDRNGQVVPRNVRFPCWRAVGSSPLIVRAVALGATSRTRSRLNRTPVPTPVPP